MKIEELFIGAWVQEYRPAEDRLCIPMQVVGLFQSPISQDTVCLDFEGNEADPWEAELKDLRGIPVTEDILLKNGFVKDVYFDDVYVYVYDNFWVEKDGEHWFIDTDDTLSTATVFRVKNLCVHQLQEALRWAGVDLKVKL